MQHVSGEVFCDLVYLCVFKLINDVVFVEAVGSEVLKVKEVALETGAFNRVSHFKRGVLRCVQVSLESVVVLKTDVLNLRCHFSI